MTNLHTNFKFSARARGEKTGVCTALVLSFQIMSEFKDQSSPMTKADEITIKPKELSSPGKLAVKIEEKKTAHKIDNKVETEDKCNFTPDIQRQNPTTKPVGLENAKQTTGQQFG